MARAPLAAGAAEDACYQVLLSLCSGRRSSPLPSHAICRESTFAVTCRGVTPSLCTCEHARPPRELAKGGSRGDTSAEPEAST